MSFLGSIGKALGGVVKQVLPSVVKSIAGPASSLLKGTIGDLFQKGAGALKGLLNASPLPNVIKSLGEKLLGTGVEKLTQLAGQGIDGIIKKLGDMVLKRFAPDAGNVAPPSIQNSPDRQTQIGTNNPAPTGTGSNTGAATGGGSTGKTPGGVADKGAEFGWKGGPPSPEGRNMEDPAVAAQFQREMMAYQNAMNNMKLMMETLSKMFSSQIETAQGMVRNIK
ncbi:MAG: hypothetical protein JNM17_37610 [Archangium sp.]|nr:hypothetical protein [Archangium sp.]